jgi:predicted ATP-dependent endonuclease of OLD family
MHIERLALTGFRAFGPDPTTIDLTPGLTAFVGANGAGKTAVMLALQRLFGITSEQRRLRRQDFHVPAGRRLRLLSGGSFSKLLWHSPSWKAVHKPTRSPSSSTRWRRTRPAG